MDTTDENEGETNNKSKPENKPDLVTDFTKESIHLKLTNMKDRIPIEDQKAK